MTQRRLCVIMLAAAIVAVEQAVADEDFLRLDPSLDLQQRAPDGVQADLSIRGGAFGVRPDRAPPRRDRRPPARE